MTNSKILDQKKKEIDMIDEIDNTISAICKEIREAGVKTVEDAYKVKALAKLVMARAQLIRY